MRDSIGTLVHFGNSLNGSEAAASFHVVVSSFHMSLPYCSWSNDSERESIDLSTVHLMIGRFTDR